MTRPTVVITGATGFVGRHLVRLAAEAGYRVWAIGREDAPPADTSSALDHYVQADLTASWPINEPVDAVIHLAGLAAVGRSFSAPQEYLETNSRMVTAMCEAALVSSQPSRVLIVSSGAVYAPQPGGSVDETSPTAATSPYAVSKLLVETQAAYYAHRGLDIAVARPFNHIGPGQGRGFLIPDLTASLRERSTEHLLVGNLDTARDYTDVRDVARAYLAIVTAPERRSLVYNVASGVSHTGREILTAICDDLGVAIPPLEVEAARLRPGDPERIVGSAERLRSEFGWSPEIGWRQSITDFISAENGASKSP